MFRATQFANRFANPSGAAVRINVTDERDRPVQLIGADQPTKQTTTAPAPEPQTDAQLLMASAKDYAQRVFKPAWDAILDYRIVGSDFESLQKRKSELLGSMATLIAMAAEFLSDARQAKTRDLEEQHEVARATARAQVDLVTSIQAELVPYDEQLRRAQGETARAAAVEKAWLASEPNPNSLPSPQEKEAWRDNLTGAQKQLAEAQAAENRITAGRAAIISRLQREQEKLSGHRAHLGAVNDFDRPGLLEIEARLRAQCAGEKWVDPSTGLEVPPEL
jgi:hypothetical protein